MIGLVEPAGSHRGVAGDVGFPDGRAVRGSRGAGTGGAAGEVVRSEFSTTDPDADDRAAAVAEAAARWGFAPPGRFRVVYVRLFGEPPEATLRR